MRIAVADGHRRPGPGRRRGEVLDQPLELAAGAGGVDRFQPLSELVDVELTDSARPPQRLRRVLAVGVGGPQVRQWPLGDAQHVTGPAHRYDRPMPDRLHFTDSDEANQLLARDPMALLIGFALDQQVTVQKAFAGPLAIQERLGTIEAHRLAATDLEPVFRQQPAVHRFPGSMAKRVHDLAAHIAETYDGDAARVWTDASTSEELKANLEALPGFGKMKVGSTAAVLARRFGVASAEALVPEHPTLGDVDSREALATYQAGKRAQKARMRAEKAGVSSAGS